MRPFNFMVAFWGKRYRDYFVDLCLPSLLAPNNLPLLRADDGHRYLIATTWEDWEAIRSLPVFAEASKYLTPTLIEIPERDEEATGDTKFDRYVATIQRQERCFRMLLETAHRNRSYGNLISPDMMASDHLVSSLIRAAEQGYQLVLRPALRQVEEDVLAELATKGVLRVDAASSLTGRALIMTPRMVADLGMRHLHPEILAFSTEAPNQQPLPPFLLWPMQQRGFILHTFFAVPIMIDFTAVPDNHTDCMQHGTFEEVYIKTNFAAGGRAYVIQDSDDCGFLSLTPKDVNWAPPVAGHGGGLIHEYRQLCNMRRAVRTYADNGGSRIKRDLFRLPVRWHADDLDAAWKSKERRIDRLIDLAVGDFYASDELSLRRTFGGYWRWLAFEAPRVPRVYGVALAILSRLLRAAGGDREMQRWIAERVRVRLRQVLRR
jgi:hypothetical protein